MGTVDGAVFCTVNGGQQSTVLGKSTVGLPASYETFCHPPLTSVAKQGRR